MKIGIHTIPMAAYLADPCPSPSLSSSCAHRLLVKSPLHAWAEHPKLGGQSGKQANAADTGSVAHDILLHGEGTIAVIDPAKYPAANGNIPEGWTNPSIRAARDAARSKGLTPILAAEMPAIHAMADTAREFVSRSEIAGIFERGRPEQTIIWREGETWCRARPDWLTDDRDVVLHFKTTKASARPERFIRGIMQDMGYGFALQFYKRGLAAVVGGTEKTRHLILVQEQEAPYACSLIGLAPAKAAIEDARVARAIDLWTECVKTDTWPGYDSRVHWADPTPWELAQSELDQQEGV
jgi:hypothetical protein